MKIIPWLEKQEEISDSSSKWKAPILANWQPSTEDHMDPYKEIIGDLNLEPQNDL